MTREKYSPATGDCQETCPLTVWFAKFHNAAQADFIVVMDWLEVKQVWIVDAHMMCSSHKALRIRRQHIPVLPVWVRRRGFLPA
jgi:hypothetical protein